VQSSGSAPWIGDFINSIRSVYYLSTVLLLAAIVPSVMRGKANNSSHAKEIGAGGGPGSGVPMAPGATPGD